MYTVYQLWSTKLLVLFIIIYFFLSTDNKRRSASDDEDWELTALEEDKRSFPELVIEVGGKSYAAAVLQHTDRDRESKTEAFKVIPMDQEYVDTKRPTIMKVKPHRKHDLKKQNKVINENEFTREITSN